MTAALATHDPAVAVAMSRCLAARFRDPDHRSTPSHELACGWCDYPDDEIKRAVEEFNAWADYNRHGISRHHDVRVFREQPKAEQERAIAAAQALGNELWHLAPAPTEPTAPAEAPPPETEEDIPWLA